MYTPKKLTMDRIRQTLRRVYIRHFRKILTFQGFAWLGTAVNLGVLWVLVDGFHWGKIVSVMTSIEVAIIHNFTWYYLITWRQHVRLTFRDYLRRLLHFNIVTAAIDYAMNIPVFWALIHFLNIHYLIAAGVSMILSPILKYLVNDHWVFSARVAKQKG